MTERHRRIIDASSAVLVATALTRCSPQLPFTESFETGEFFEAEWDDVVAFVQDGASND